MQNRKHSKKRDAILGVIQSTTEHPGAKWVYEQLKPRIPALSLGTVYRNIKVLRDDGELASVGVVDGEERFDGMVAAHPHFICEKCGEVLDLSISAKIGARAFKIPGYAIDIRKTVFYGLCKTCNTEKAALGR